MIFDYIRLKDSGFDEKIEVFNDISIDKNLDNLISEMSFTMPYIVGDSSHISNKIKKYTYIEYWVKVDSSISTTNYRCKFRGYIDTISKSISKSDRKLQISCLDKLSLYDRIDFTNKLTIVNSLELITQAFIYSQQYLHNAIIDGLNVDYSLASLSYEIRADISKILLASLEVDSSNLLNYLRAVREQTILYIYYDSEKDKVIITDPEFLQYNYRDNTELSIVEFDTEKNLLGTISYGEITNDYNEVHIIGIEFNGYARDTTAQLNGSPKVYIKYDYSGAGVVSLDKQAANILLDMLRSYKIQFSIPFIKEGLDVQIGEMVTINDHDTLTPTLLSDGAKIAPIFIVRKITYTVNKDDVIITVEASASSIIDIPEKYVIDKDLGVASRRIDVLKEQKTDNSSWFGGLFE